MAEHSKILLVISGLGAGGAERVASTMANYWAEQGRAVGLLTLANLQDDHFALTPAVTRLSLDIIWPSRNPWHGLISSVQRIRMIRRAIVQYDPDVVVSFIDRTNILVIAASLFSAYPVIVSERIDPRHHTIDRVRRVLRRLLYPLARSVVVQTRSVAEWAHRITLPGRVCVIANPIGDLPEAPETPARAAQLVAVGRLTHQKGFDLLVDAFAASRLCREGWTLKIIGEGPARGGLEQQLEDLHLTAQVSLPGILSEPWRELRQARIFVLSSRFEGFPNVLLEAMAMGCACVAVDCPSGPGEIISDGEDGILVSVENVDALTSALDRFESDPQLAGRLAGRAQQVRDRFAVDIIMAEWDALIGRIAGKHPGYGEQQQ